ncbi:hypothetical protein B2G88_04125 [Natronolimnobius baerhuensis]|uniref:Uncharacterized protein n=1 Tax=Natronolimnobius baerhuensis TaxID=253108 RepID=A0A202ECI7_9EURY|nr:hypothetical protein B2G88_04125 [Natronolimnobius baerhuensis]
MAPGDRHPVPEQFACQPAVPDAGALSFIGTTSRATADFRRTTGIVTTATMYTLIAELSGDQVCIDLQWLL